MTLEEFTKQAIEPALRLLPDAMDSKEARVMLLAIPLQESELKHRRQLVGKPPRPTGPAKSFYQGERGGGMVAGVRQHPATSRHAQKLYFTQDVEPSNQAIWDAIEHDDVLAAGLARLLLWSDPKALPKLGDEEGAFQLYLRTWRPGAWDRGSGAERANLRRKWSENYKRALAYVNQP